MIARIGRLAGAILAECDGTYLLIGNTKEPCNWEQSGFTKPTEIDARKTPVLQLEPLPNASISISSPHLVLTLTREQKDTYAPTIASRFLITRNASVSDRLWNLITEETSNPELEATWLLNLPDPIWQIVRDTVLKCT
jgi:hypothetical protein